MQCRVFGLQVTSAQLWVDGESRAASADHEKWGLAMFGCDRDCRCDGLGIRGKQMPTHTGLHEADWFERLSSR